MCLILCDPMDCSPPGSSVHGISQARILEWVAISSSMGSSQPRDWTYRPASPALQADSFTTKPPRKPQKHLCSTNMYMDEYLSCVISENFSGNSDFSWVIHLNCTRPFVSLFWVFIHLLALWDFINSVVILLLLLGKKHICFGILEGQEWEGHGVLDLGRLPPPRDAWQWVGSFGIVTSAEWGLLVSSE